MVAFAGRLVRLAVDAGLLQLLSAGLDISPFLARPICIFAMVGRG
jgi:hypothetical protein